MNMKTAHLKFTYNYNENKASRNVASGKIITVGLHTNYFIGKHIYFNDNNIQ